MHIVQSNVIYILWPILIYTNSKKFCNNYYINISNNQKLFMIQLMYHMKQQNQNLNSLPVGILIVNNGNKFVAN